VVDQEYPRLEYIVQDGGSTDESLSLIRKYEAKLASWDSSPDRGQTHAINRGMRKTTGEIMAFLNSDDILLPGSLAYVAAYFRRNPHVDVVYGHRLLINERGQDIGRWVLPPHDDNAIVFADYVPQETMFWRRRAWERVGSQLDESFCFALDWDLILRFRAAGLQFVRLPRFLGGFRITEEQKTTQLIQTVGAREMARLRERELGREPSRREIRKGIRSYMWRHWWYETLFSLGFLAH
jgi:glycosyltransferase involved in cell wall biosynthesis